MEHSKLTLEEQSLRVLTVLYKMSGGKEIPIATTDLLDEVNLSGVLNMSQNDFEEYRQSVIKSAKSFLN